MIFYFDRKTRTESLKPVSVCDCDNDCKVDDFVNDLLSDDTPPPPCKPVNNILFLKTHKTGSSTVTNILNRYGDTRDLMFALPISRSLYSFFWPRPFQLRFTQAFGRAPNILCNHARYNKVPMNWLFPKTTTRYITILSLSLTFFILINVSLDRKTRSSHCKRFFKMPRIILNK